MKLKQQCALVFAVLVCVAAMPFRATMAPEASPQAGVFASKMLEVGKSRWQREGRTNAGEFGAVRAPVLVAAIPQNPVGGGSQPGQRPGPIETMGGSTSCPVEHTQCPAEATLCPILSTQCPVQATVCKATACPVNPTHCPVVSTSCQTTVCPVNTTFCPMVATSCPAIPTACPVGATSCPVVTTACPVDTTTCPNTETQCQIVATQCPEDYTVCPFTETTCDDSSTFCNTVFCQICVVTYDSGPAVWFEPPVAVASVAQVQNLMVIGSPAPIRTVL